MTKRCLALMGLLLMLLPVHADRWKICQRNFFAGESLILDSLEAGLERLVTIAQMVDDKGVIRTDPNRQDEYSAWRLIPTGERSRETGQLTCYIQNVGTGRYISGVGITSLGQARAWQWVFFPRLRDSLYIDYPDVCHFAMEGDSLVGYPPKDSLWNYQLTKNIWLIEFYESSGYDRYMELLDSLGQRTTAVEDFYVAGSEPGCIPQELYDRMMATVNYLKSLTTDLDDAVYAEAVDRFYRDKHAADSAAEDVKEGFYRIYKQNNYYQRNSKENTDCIVYGDGLFLREHFLGNYFPADNDPMTVFHITKRADGNYDFRCLYDSLYVVPTKVGDDTVRMASTQPAVGLAFDAWSHGRFHLKFNIYKGDDVFVHYFQSLGFGTNEDSGLTGDPYRANDQYRLIPVPAHEVDSLRGAALQTRHDVRLAALVDEARTLLRQTLIYTGDTLHPVVRQADQLDCNALHTLEENRDLGALLDGDIKTRIATQFTNTRAGDSVYAPKLGRNVALPNARHYLQVQAADGTTLPDSLFIRWTIASSRLDLAPTGLRLLRSRDGQAWEPFATLGPETEGFATTYMAPVYTSSLITPGAGYRLLRLEVTANARNRTDKYGHPAMALAEFNLYPVLGIDPRSQGLRPEVSRAAGALQVATNAAATVPARTTTSAHIATMLAAIDAFRTVWADTTRLEALTTQALHYDATASVGTAIGQATARAVADLHQAAASATALRPYYHLTRVEVDTATARLARAIALYQALIVMPGEDEGYFLVSASTGRLRGQCLLSTDYTLDANLDVRATTAGNEQNALAAWRFIALDEPGMYGVQNMASGLYLGAGRVSDTLVPLRLVTLGARQMALVTRSDGYMLSAGGGTIRVNDALNNAAWTFTAVDHERMTDIKFLHPRAAQVVCLPYATTQLPTSIYAPLEWYEPLGLECDDEGRIVGLALGLTPDETLQPGKPYVLVMGPSIESDDDDLAVDMCMDLDAPATVTAPTPAAGLRGTFAPLRIARPGVAYFDHSNTLRFTTDTAEVLIATHSGFVVPAALPRLALGAAADLTLPVAVDYRLVQFLDHNGDGRLNLPDAITIITRITAGEQDPLGLTDHNGDGRSDLPDAITLIRQMVDE